MAIIELKDLCKSFGKLVVLGGINLTIEKGETLAMVGPTGAGKTTLINLLTRFYELGSGRITIDGKDIVNVRKAELRRNLGIVLQDTFLFSGTVLENIRYGRLEATDEECMEAAKLSGADAFVRTYDAGGAEGWVRQFGTPNHDTATGVAIDPSGRVLVVGRTHWSRLGQPRIEPSGFVRCFDAAGYELWERQFGIHQGDESPAIAVDRFGDVLIAYTAGADGPSDSVVMKLDASGDQRWSRRVGTTTNDWATAVAIDAPGNVFVAGTTTYRLEGLWGGFRTDAFVWRFSP